MTYRRHTPRDLTRLLERLVALAEAYGAGELEDLRADMDALLLVEMLTLERRVRTAQEHARRVVARVATSAHRGECACPHSAGP